MASFGELVKALIVRFTSEGYKPVKAEIDSIPDHKTVKIDIDSSAFGAAVAALRARIDREAAALGPSFWSKLLFRGFGQLNLPGPLPNLPAFFTSLPGLAVAVGALGAAATSIDMLVSGFAAAGAGVTAFGILARPTFAAVSGAITQIKADTLAYQQATTSAARSAALKQIKADWAALDPVQKTAVQDIMDLQTQLGVLGGQFEKQLSPIINTLLGHPQQQLLGFLRGTGPGGRGQPIFGMSSGGVIWQILQDLPKFANPAAKAIEGLLQQLNNFLKSPGAQQFQAALAKLVGPSITAIGQGIGQVALAVGKLLTIFSAKDITRAIHVFFDIIVGAIKGIAWFIQANKGIWDQLSRGAVTAWHAVSHAIDNIHHAVNNMGHFFTVVFDGIKRGWDAFNHAIDNARHAVAVGARDIWNAITTILNPAKLAAFLVNSGRAIISGLIAGIKSMIGPLQSILGWVTSLIPHIKGPIEKDRILLYPSGVAIMQGLMGGIGSQVPGLYAQLGGITSGIGNRGPHGVGIRYGGAGGGITLNVHVAPGTSPNETARQIQKMLLQLKRNNGGAALGLA